MLVNPFEAEGKWYKANLHTHTTASDGKCELEERVEQYRANGYDVLAITDHGVVSDATHLGTDDFLVLDGVELTVTPFENGRFYHLLCINTPSDLSFPGDLSPNFLIFHLKTQGAECLIAHPYWSGNTLPELLYLEGHVGIEVFNAGCQNIGKAYSSVHWDDMLEAGVEALAIAVDDVHSAGDYLDLFGGWTMLKMQELSPQAVLEALRTGCYYSSSGAEILDFCVTEGMARLRCEDALEIHLMASAWHGCSLYAGDGPPLTEAHVNVDSDWKYIRAEIVNARGKRAWANPIFL